MNADNPPQDQEILDLLNASPKGLTPSEIIDTFIRQDHTFEEVIEALQRVIERGLVEIASGARLVAFQEQHKAFA